MIQLAETELGQGQVTRPSSDWCEADGYADIGTELHAKNIDRLKVALKKSKNSEK